MEIPVIFRPGELYAVSSFAGAWVYIGAHYIGLSALVAGVLAFADRRRPAPGVARFGVRVPDPLWLREERRKT